MRRAAHAGVGSVANETPQKLRRICDVGGFVAGRATVCDRLEKNADLVLRTQRQRLVVEQVDHGREREEFRTVRCGRRRRRPSEAARRCRGCAACRCRSARCRRRTRCVAERVGPATRRPISVPMTVIGGAERQHTVRPARRCRHPVNDVAEHARNVGRILDQRVRIRRRLGFRAAPYRRAARPSRRRPAEPIGQEAEGAIEIAAERDHDQIERRVTLVGAEIANALGMNLQVERALVVGLARRGRTPRRRGLIAAARRPEAGTTAMPAPMPPGWPSRRHSARGAACPPQSTTGSAISRRRSRTRASAAVDLFDDVGRQLRQLVRA